MFEQVERFRCGVCGYITESGIEIQRIKSTGICPACGNGNVRTPSWYSNRQVRKG